MKTKKEIVLLRKNQREAEFKDQVNEITKTVEEYLIKYGRFQKCLLVSSLEKGEPYEVAFGECKKAGYDVKITDNRHSKLVTIELDEGE